MSAASVERFELEKSSRRLFLAAPWMCLLLAGFFAIAPWLPDEVLDLNGTQAFRMSVVAGLGFVGFAVGAWYSFRIVRRLPESAISLDADGLWPSMRGKGEALLRWNEIARLRERPNLQRLELFDAADALRLRLEYQLQDFDRLRALVLERAHLQPRTEPVHGTYRKSAWYHVGSVGALLGITLAGWYLRNSGAWIIHLGVSAIVVMCSWDYLTTPFRLRITGDALEVSWPFRLHSIPRDRVKSIAMDDEFANGYRQPRVSVQVNDRAKPILLKDFGMPAVDLHQILQAWHHPERHQG